jgi:ABC-2 type transport system permease protein
MLQVAEPRPAGPSADADGRLLDESGVGVVRREGRPVMSSASLLGRPGGFTTSATSKLSVAERLRRVIDYRRILWLLVRRDLKVRYAGSALGYLWSVLDPLLMSLVYWFVFVKIFQRQVGFPPYVLFLVLGQIMWAWFNGGVTGCVRALRAEAQMVRQSNVPRELWVLRVIVSKGMEFVFSLPVVALFAVGYLKSPRWETVVFLPASMAMCFLLVLGLGLILAPLAVLIRDVERIIPIVMRVLFYASPVLYSVKDVPAKLHPILSINPTTGMLVLFRGCFFRREISGIVPKTDVHRHVLYHKVLVNGVLRRRPVLEHVNNWHFVWHSAIGIAVILVLGVFIFARLERPVLKEI